MRRFDLPLVILAVIVAAGWLLARGSRAPVSLDGPSSEEADVPARMERLLPRDAIAPIYRPRFVSAAGSRLRPDDLVLGVEINGEAKAYPITILNAREMVNDVVGGVPILATW